MTQLPAARSSAGPSGWGCRTVTGAPGARLGVTLRPQCALLVLDFLRERARGAHLSKRGGAEEGLEERKDHNRRSSLCWPLERKQEAPEAASDKLQEKGRRYPLRKEGGRWAWGLRLKDVF